jgi:hypothetical protein
LKRPFVTLASRIAWSCPWYQIRQDDLRLPDGSAGVYNVVEKTPAAWIVPVTAAGQLVLIRNYRYTVDDWCLEIPAGSLLPDQAKEEAAARELREEVGALTTCARSAESFAGGGSWCPCTIIATIEPGRGNHPGRSQAMEELSRTCRKQTRKQLPATLGTPNQARLFPARSTSRK